jgi:hypothetical protein
VEWWLMERNGSRPAAAVYVSGMRRLPFVFDRQRRRSGDLQAGWQISG